MHEHEGFSTSGITALRFCDPLKTGHALPLSLLNDFVPVPRNLKYIGWDVDQEPKTYEVQRSGDTVRLVECFLKREYKMVDWTSGSLLDHVDTGI